ncbi:hypothetical protein [Paenibacillus humicola]|uniref:hypothetical protein n=1 Tax=Paenibacillus humicola TaxID=3110540 RepID=UPI00237B444C|nr:hypothetical protein [Paenibacillus humicola]
MISKYSAALLSAVSITLFAAYFQFEANAAAADLYFSFPRQFFGGLFLILAIQLFVFIPISLFVDGLIVKFFPGQHGMERKLAAVIGYAAAPAALVFLAFLLLTTIRAGIAYALLAGLGGLAFGIVQELLRRFFK